MSNVAAILQAHPRPVITVSPQASTIHAAQLMNGEHIGALVVVDNQRVLGIFTERDMLNRVVAINKDPAKTTVGDVMTREPICARPDSTRAECEAVMRRRRIRHLPVIDDGELVGMISVHDLLEDMAHEQAETIHTLYDFMNVAWSE
ncbi:MAG: CBS domain-containing protein [Phycisphaerales bacterium]|nr:CBS domain-containing protein [Phycisphaerales bacterium]